MNNEIKEILDNVRKCCEIMQDENFVVYQKQDIIKLLDYITNLQEINNNLKEDFKRHIDRINELTNRIEKAVEYIEKHRKVYKLGVNQETDEFDYISTSPRVLLNILNGKE